jgi:hypothetical protein
MSGALGALSQAWVSVEASRPLGWKLTGLVLTEGDEWLATAAGPDGLRPSPPGSRRLTERAGRR